MSATIFSIKIKFDHFVKKNKKGEKRVKMKKLEKFLEEKYIYRN